MVGIIGVGLLLGSSVALVLAGKFLEEYMIGSQRLKKGVRFVEKLAERFIVGRCTKQCWTCHSELPKTEFKYDSRYPDKLFPDCTYCIRELQEGTRFPEEGTRFPSSEEL